MLVFAGGAETTNASTTSNYSTAKQIVYAIFPRDTEAAALRVVGCETGYTYYSRSYNSSGATGYFQILQGNGGRVLHYKGSTLKIQAWRLWDAAYNTIVALFLSKGGHDWHEWSCQP